MKVILHRGGNYHDARFDASPDPQDVPDKFGAAMIGRGLADRVDEPAKKPAAKKPAVRSGGDVPAPAPATIGDGEIVTPADSTGSEN